MMLERIAEAMLRAREALQTEFGKLHRAMLAIVRERRGLPAADDGARHWSVDRRDLHLCLSTDPSGFLPSRAVGAHFGLTPKRYQSGETDITGAVSRVGDPMVRTVLYEGAHIMLTRAVRFSALKHWALQVAKRRGMRRAVRWHWPASWPVILHRIRVDGSTFRWAAR